MSDQDEELLIQRLNTQADADEAEAARILTEVSEEEAKANAEYEQALAEYNAALDDVVKAELAKEDIGADARRELEEYQANRNVTGQQDVNEAIISTYNDYYANTAKRTATLQKADELQALGLIPVDATNEQRIQYVDIIAQAEETKQKGYEELFKNRSPAILDRIARHKALIKAHNEFQKKYRNEILQFRYGYSNDYYNDVYVKQYEEFWLIGGSRLNPMARMGHRSRVFSRITFPTERAGDTMPYHWDGAKWVEDPGGWIKRGINWRPQTLEEAFFDLDGRFPSDIDWLPIVQDESGFRKGGTFYAQFAAGPHSIQGKWNTKRSYAPCKPGYWLYETLPEEASPCVYMGGSMVDTNASYYPASVAEFVYKINDLQTKIENRLDAEGVTLTADEAKKQAEANNIPITDEQGDLLAAAESQVDTGAQLGSAYTEGLIGSGGSLINTSDAFIFTNLFNKV